MADENLAGVLNQIATNGNMSNRQLGSMMQILASIFPFSSVVGTFTLGAAATTVVSELNVKTNSVILWIPTNASAGTLEGSAKCLYLSARSAGVSFTVATASAAAAAGTETYTYVLINPTG